MSSSCYSVKQMKKPMHSGKLNYMSRLTYLKTGPKGGSAGSWKTKTMVFPLKLKLQGCLRPCNNGPGADTPAHRYSIHFLLKARLIFSTGEQSAVGKSKRSRSRSALGWLSCCPDPGSFPEAQATSIESFKYKTHVPNSLLEGGGVGEGRGDDGPGTSNS